MSKYIVLASLGTLLALGTGCFYGGSEVHREAPEEPHPVMETQGVCGLSFRPDEEIREDAFQATARWSIATGCEFTVDDNGIVPVHLVDHVYKAYEWATGREWTTTEWVEDPEVGYFESCGQTDIKYYGTSLDIISIDVYIARNHPENCGYGTLRHVTLHEIGHAIQNQSSYRGVPHTDTPTLMNANVTNVHHIAEPDLELICSGLDCQHMQSED